MGTPDLLELDEARRLVRLTLAGVRGHRVGDALVELYARRPDVSTWNFLYDTRGFDEPSPLDDITRLAAADRAAKAQLPPPGPMRTAVLTHDRFFGLWAAVIKHQFPGRDIRGFPTLDAAERFVIPTDAAEAA